ncbi:MAG: hypothetical protein K2L31_09815 [Muribaculum sp.]|nr:hypothetical protein [Muribaculum sp.]MDE6458876.1 hypothetical protein [Muribaculum sp.]
MNGKLQMFLAILSVYPLGLQAQGIDDVISSLKSINHFDATVDYSVLMSLQDDVDYTLHLKSWNAPADTLAPCDYLIDWKVATPDGESTGFSAYYDGNVYNFRGDKLLEYHYDSNKSLFQARGMGAASLPGVQRRAQFSELLPQFIAEQLDEIKNNPDYRYIIHTDTVINGTNRTAIDGTMTMSGQVMKEFLYVFDKAGMPVMVNMENNPGALAEQSITATYAYSPDTAAHERINEDILRGIYPEIFDRYRESNFAIENLPGQRLPGFALPTTTGERYSRMLGDKFRCPTVIVMLDAKGAFSSPTVSAVRSAVDSLPFNSDIIWAFSGNNVDDIEAIVPQIRVGEHLLMSAKPLARDCGVTSYPSIIVCRADGTVADIVLGYNNDLSSVVIQKVADAAK